MLRRSWNQCTSAGLHFALLGGLGEKPQGPDKGHTCRSRDADRLLAHTLSPRGDNQRGGIGQPTMSADHLVHLTGSIQREASQRARWLETLHRESAAADGGVINETILIGL